MPRPVSVASAYEILLAKRERRDPRPEYVMDSNAELVPAKGDDAGSRGEISSPTSPASRVFAIAPDTSRREHEPDDEHALIDEYGVE